MFKATDFSFDIETLGSRPYSSVISIGAVGFNRHTGEIHDEGFHIVVSATDCAAKGLRMDPDTVIWWMQQNDAARKVFSPGGGTTTDYALEALNKYLEESCNFSNSSGVWGNGSGFDINLLEDMYELSRPRCPWRFWQSRDVRTVVDIAALDKKAYRLEGTHHNALDDAINQAKMVIDGIAKLKGTL